MITFNKKNIEELESSIFEDKRITEIVNKNIPIKDLKDDEIEKLILYNAFLIAEELYLARESKERNDIIKKTSDDFKNAQKETNRLIEEAIKKMNLNNKEMDIKYEQQAKQNK